MNRGTKRKCQSCGAPYYDLGKDPVCPKCETPYEAPTRLAARTRIKPSTIPSARIKTVESPDVLEDEVEDLELADDDVIADEDLEDDQDNDLNPEEDLDQDRDLPMGDDDDIRDDR